MSSVQSMAGSSGGGGGGEETDGNVTKIPGEVLIDDTE